MRFFPITRASIRSPLNMEETLGLIEIAEAVYRLIDDSHDNWIWSITGTCWRCRGVDYEHYEDCEWLVFERQLGDPNNA